MSLDDDIRDELRQLAAAHRLRVPRVLDGAQGPIVRLDGAEVVNFASNDYLGLAGDRRLVAAAHASLDEDGAGAGSSRLIVGNHRRHVLLESGLAEWLGQERAQLFNSGYAANVGVMSTLARAGDVVFSDELNHASIIDGCRLSRAEIVVFPHRDLAALESALSTHRGRRRLIVTESLFSMDGDVADVAATAALARRHDASLILDEAHALGVLGPQGRGVAAAAQVVPDVVIGTFGKALGGFGAFAASSTAVVELLWNRARSLVFSTGLPPPVAAAALAALEIVRGSEGDDRRRTLAAHAGWLRSCVPELGGDDGSPIAPIAIGDDRRVMQISERLLADRVFVQGIRPPTVPAGTARLRLSLSAAHTPEHMKEVASAIRNAMRQEAR
ncbi:MAG: 8-amino-7-oxononanoate synthase [Myxococcota bacterium]|nr:8-amino-7-oxononanoate synthase [Myxococcota bacterium]